MYLSKIKFDISYGVPIGKHEFSDLNYKKFSSCCEATVWAERFYGEWSEKYNDIYGMGGKSVMSEHFFERYSGNPISNYCGNSYSNLNHYLRKTGKSFIEGSCISDVLSTVLLLSPRVPENIVLYRYVPEKVINMILQKNKCHSGYQDKGFLSCSLLLDTPSREYFDSQYVLELYVEKNTVGVYTNLIATCDRGEFEILILRNAKMCLVDYPYKIKGKTIYKVKLKI